MLQELTTPPVIESKLNRQEQALKVCAALLAAWEEFRLLQTCEDPPLSSLHPKDGEADKALSHE